MNSLVFACALVILSGVAYPTPSGPQTPVGEHPFVGSWTADLSKSKLSPDFKVEAATLQFDVTDSTVTISSGLVLASGQEQRVAETFRTDGTEVPGTLSPGVTLVARWVSARILETRAKKDGQEIGVVTYEVSADGDTLTSTSSGAAMPNQLIVFERNRLVILGVPLS